MGICDIGLGKGDIFIGKEKGVWMEDSGIEPLTSSMPLKRSPS